MNRHADRIARLDRIALPAIQHRAPHGAHFESVVQRLAGWIRYRHTKPDMGIVPLEFLDHAFIDDGLLLIEHGEGMMGESGRGKPERQARQADNFEVHRRLPTPGSAKCMRCCPIISQRPFAVEEPPYSPVMRAVLAVGTLES